MKEIDFMRLDFLNNIKEDTADGLAGYIFSYNAMVRDQNIIGAISYYYKIIGMMNGIIYYENIPDKYFTYINNRIK